MTIALFDKFLNTLPISVLEGKDVSQVIIIDPPEGLPPSLLAYKGVLDTETKQLSIYNADGTGVDTEFKLTDLDVQQIVDDLEAVKTTADNADALSKTNAALLDDALIKDAEGWNVDSLNIYNVSRLSKTSNASSSSGISINNVDVNLHGDTVGITSANSFTTYAVFNAGGLNLNDYPLTRMASGGDTDTNAANIGDVKRIATDGSGLKPTDDEWDMLNYPIINVGTSTDATSAATVGQVNAVDSKADANATEIGNVKTTADSALSKANTNESNITTVTTTANAADALSKDNKTRLDNLPPAPDLNKYAELLTDVAFNEVKATSLDFSDSNTTATINHDHNIDVSVSGTKNIAFKSNGMKLLSPVDGDGHNINHAGDIHFNSNKKLFGSGAGNLQIRYAGAIYRGDGTGSNIQFDAEKDIRITGDHIRWFHTDGHQYGGISKTGINLRDTTKIVGLPQGSDDTDATNLGHIKSLIAASGGGVDFENYITRTDATSATFFETTSGQQNAWVVSTNTAGTSSLTYTFDYSRSGQEVVAGIENRTPRTIIAKLQTQQSVNTTIEVPAYSVMSARYVPDIGHYTYNVGSWYPTEQRVVRLQDLNYSTASDPRDVTKNIINAMPNNSICIARHEAGSSSKNTANKNRFISRGNANAVESEECIAIIVKHSTDRATGMSTTQGGNGKAWSRVLDGKRHAWFTNDTADSFSLSGDIDLNDYPEGKLFLTGDKGMMISGVDEDGESILTEVSGYNVPKNEQDIAALEIQTEKNRSVTHTFINEPELNLDWPDDQRKPLVEVQVLNTSSQIENSYITVTDNNDGTYSGQYNTVGSIAINTLGNWANVYTYHNAYKHDSQDYYVVFNQANYKWELIVAQNPHTSIGEHAAASTIQLGDKSSLPSTFGDYAIDPHFDNIDSLEFLTAEVPIQYDDVNSKVIINFNGAKPSGYVVLK